MIEIKNNKQAKEIRAYLAFYEGLKDVYEDDNTCVYSLITISLAVKYDLVIPDFLFHPVLLKTRKFHELPEMIKDFDNMIIAITSVITYELTADLLNTRMSTINLKRLIKKRKELIKNGN